VFFAHLLGCFLLMLVQLMLGTLTEAFYYCLEHPFIYGHMLVFSCSGYIGILFVLPMIRSFGSFVAMTTTSCRKACTLILSFLLFPNTLTMRHALAIASLFSGLLLHVFAKNPVAIYSLISFIKRWLDPPQRPLEHLIDV